MPTADYKVYTNKDGAEIRLYASDRMVAHHFSKSATPEGDAPPLIYAKVRIPLNHGTRNLMDVRFSVTKTKNGSLEIDFISPPPRYTRIVKSLGSSEELFDAKTEAEYDDPKKDFANDDTELLAVIKSRPVRFAPPQRLYVRGSAAEWLEECDEPEASALRPKSLNEPAPAQFTDVKFDQVDPEIRSKAEILITKFRDRPMGDYNLAKAIDQFAHHIRNGGPVPQHERERSQTRPKPPRMLAESRSEERHIGGPRGLGWVDHVDTVDPALREPFRR